MPCSRTQYRALGETQTCDLVINSLKLFLRLSGLKTAVIKNCSFNMYQYHSKYADKMANSEGSSGSKLGLHCLPEKSDMGLHCLPETSDMGLHCFPRPEHLKVHIFRLFTCFQLAALHLICGELARLRKTLDKQNYFL